MKPAFIPPDRKKQAPSLHRYRWMIASRSVAAIFGGYGLAAAFSTCMSLILPLAGMSRSDAVLTSTMLAFVIHAVAALWAFSCTSTWRTWTGILIPAVLFTLLAWIAGVQT